MTKRSKIATDPLFKQLNPVVQQWIVGKNWEEFRPIQENVIPKLINVFRQGTPKDFVISAPTAGGKTEAVFLPIANLLTDTNKQQGSDFSVLYICPLKALIDQQAERLSGMFPPEFPIIPWHGDTSKGKKSFKQSPKGVVVITPESLESQLSSEGTEIPRYYEKLQCVVIDELHSFFNAPRGMQILAQMSRIEKILGRAIPRIALSATFNNSVHRKVGKFLRPSAQGNVEFCTVPSNRKIEFNVNTSVGEPTNNAEDDLNLEVAKKIFSDFHTLEKERNGERAKGLIFVNSRQLAEYFGHKLSDLSIQNKSAVSFRVHHGSLSSGERANAIMAIKNPNESCVVICTTTLELGIDIGAIRQVGQIDPGYSVASLQQRLGRSGRGHGEISKLFVYVRENQKQQSNSILSKLHFPTFQALAQLSLVRDGIFETHDFRPANLSTLVQQILSFCKQRAGEAPIEELSEVLIDNGPFVTLRGNHNDHFLLVLKQLLQNQFLKQNDRTKHISLGERGSEYIEKLKFNFFNAFDGSKDYSVFASDVFLGKIPLSSSFKIGDEIIFSGRLWLIVSKNTETRIINVIPSMQGQSPSFPGDPIAPSAEVIGRMLALYKSGGYKPDVLNKFDKNTKKLYEEGQKVFKEKALWKNRIIDEGRGVLVFPWVDERIQLSLIQAIRYWGLKAIPAKAALFIENTNSSEVKAVFAKIVAKPLSNGKSENIPSPTEAARDADSLLIDKHDWLLSPYLKRWNYASCRLDMEQVASTIQNILNPKN
jgi:ATP-dependent Lhr-like helicase